MSPEAGSDVTSLSFWGRSYVKTSIFCCYPFPIREKWVITPSSRLINPGLTKYEAEYEATCGARNYVSPRFEPKKLSFRLGSDFKSVIFAPFEFKICYLKMYVRTFLLGTVGFNKPPWKHHFLGLGGNVPITRILAFEHPKNFMLRHPNTPMTSHQKIPNQHLPVTSNVRTFLLGIVREGTVRLRRRRRGKEQDRSGEDADLFKKTCSGRFGSRASGALERRGKTSRDRSPVRCKPEVVAMPVPRIQTAGPLIRFREGVQGTAKNAHAEILRENFGNVGSGRALPVAPQSPGSQQTLGRSASG